MHKLQKPLIILTLLLSLAAAPLAHAGVAYQTTAIPMPKDLAYSSPMPFVQNQYGWAAWVSVATNDVYCWQGKQPIRGTNRNTPKQYLQINDRGQVVWQEWDGKDWEIYLWDGTSSPPVQVTKNDIDDLWPAINQYGAVVWSTFDGKKYGANYYIQGRTTVLDNNASDRINRLYITDSDWVLETHSGTDLRLLYQAGVKKYVTLFQGSNVSDRYYDLLTSYWGVAWTRFNGTALDLYYYNGTAIRQLGSQVWSPAINEKGWLAWVQTSRPGTPPDIYLYQGTGLAKRVATTEIGAAQLAMNRDGWLVWSGAHWDRGKIVDALWLYRGAGSPVPITTSAPVLNPQINQDGWVAWTQNKGSLKEVYLYVNGVVTPVDKKNEEERYVHLNQKTIDWLSVHNNKAEINRASVTLYAPYQFQYTYGNGDYYTGTVYAEASRVGASAYNYYPGKTWTTTDENKKVGQYTILSVGAPSDSYVGRSGSVTLDAYYDAESKTVYKPLSTIVSGPLGGELGYIIKYNVSDYLFGKGYFEADVGDRYEYKYTYGNGDYYTGYFYAAPGGPYYPGYKMSKRNELGRLGLYEITAMSYVGVNPSNYGNIYVSYYYDEASKKLFKPLLYQLPLGVKYLTSEVGYIINDDVDAYKFGAGYYETSL